MLYVAIDQHAKQITIAIRNDKGEDVLKRQVSTRREKIEQFFDSVVAMDSEFMAILESCGFRLYPFPSHLTTKRLMVFCFPRRTDDVRRIRDILETPRRSVELWIFQPTLVDF